jgi:hypothetical protein
LGGNACAHAMPPDRIQIADSAEISLLTADSLIGLTLLCAPLCAGSQAAFLPEGLA